MPPNEQLQAQLEASVGDSYAFEREMPRGGMSRVFAATDRALGRRVVMKVFSPELAATLSVERFKREIALAARLQHPHIVPLLSAGQAGASLYYTMPFVDGESLRERMDRTRPMPIADIARILEEVASALAYAHDVGIVHRDIKPENILFFHGQAVVLDFGIGKALSAAVRDPNDPAAGRITQTGMSLGTPTYIAPEQAAGDPSLDHRADIYALGVVAYEMICGHPPFSGRNPQLVLAAHARQAPEPLDKRRPDAPAELVRMVMKCLAKAPADRPQSAHEIEKAMVAPAVALSGGRVAAASPLARIPWWLPWTLAAVSTAIAIALALRAR